MYTIANSLVKIQLRLVEFKFEFSLNESETSSV